MDEELHRQFIESRRDEFQAFLDSRTVDATQPETGSESLPSSPEISEGKLTGAS